MRFNILQLLKNLRCHSQGKEITDADILNWANHKAKSTGRTTQIQSFKVCPSLLVQLTCYFLGAPFIYSYFFLQDKSISNGIFFLELLSAVEPRVVNWNLVTKGETGIFLALALKF